jgi:pimeloyl-ACP methyl ester carboxylesterase
MRIALLFVAGLLALPAWAAELAPCRLRGVEHEALCARVSRPLDPARPQGPMIDLHYAVLPALARNKKPDPVFFFAGGPGQSAIALAPQVAALLARFSNRRDIVLIDQRGTGRSAPLMCDSEAPTLPLAELFDLARQRERQAECLERLKALPHGDLRFYTTTIAMADADAVRAALGAARINLVGASYGTRAALEYQRQFPQRVRRAVLDGVAPPDMGLAGSVSADTQAALEALFEACERDARCAEREPRLAERWRALLASLPRAATLQHPVTGAAEGVTLTRELVLGMVRGPLYVTALAAALPAAIGAATRGRFEPLAGVASAFVTARRGDEPAAGMHYAVVCAEDAARGVAAGDAPGRDFGGAFADMYRDLCARLPPADVPPAFYTMPHAQTATLVLSGGLDPATPPRHGARVAQALGPKARHVVVAQAAHGVTALGCMRDVVYRFVDAEGDDDALGLDAGCVASVPRPPMFFFAPSARAR